MGTFKIRRGGIRKRKKTTKHSSVFFCDFDLFFLLFFFLFVFSISSSLALEHQHTHTHTQTPNIFPRYGASPKTVVKKENERGTNGSKLPQLLLLLLLRSYINKYTGAFIIVSKRQSTKTEVAQHPTQTVTVKIEYILLRLLRLLQHQSSTGELQKGKKQKNKNKTKTKKNFPLTKDEMLKLTTC